MSEEKKTIRVYNISDVPTPALERNNLVNHVFAAGRALVQPGCSVEVDKDDAATLAGLPGAVSLGLAAVEDLPASYVVAKDKMPKASKEVDLSAAPTTLAPPEPVMQSAKKKG
jgi:hypothetical protein